MAESQLINAIKDSNMTAIMFWLKHHHRVYRNRLEIDAKVEGVQQELTTEQSELVTQHLSLQGSLKMKEILQLKTKRIYKEVI